MLFSTSAGVTLAVPEIVFGLERRTISTAAPLPPRCIVRRTRIGGNAANSATPAYLYSSLSDYTPFSIGLSSVCIDFLFALFVVCHNVHIRLSRSIYCSEKQTKERSVWSLL
ncbi:MAG: hypothetical protein IJU56_04955 [Clostridia bacterium]|nr:hypothetical protein [Clostridia bacterium]